MSDALELSVSPDGRFVVFSGAVVERLEGPVPTRICRVDVATGNVEILTAGPNIDRLARYAPDGSRVAFLSDREDAGDFQLHLLDPVTGVTQVAPRVEGWIEYLHWSPDGRRILAGVAGYGADISGGQGAVASKQSNADLPSWMPAVETGDEDFRWRSAWVYELERGTWRQVGPAGTNIWEATWCGNGAFAAVVSPGPSEGLWYDATLRLFTLNDDQGRELYVPADQLGWPAGSPSGGHLAVIEAVCSDRWIVAGDLHLIDTGMGEARAIETAGVDIAHVEWCNDYLMLLGGHRGFETVIGLYDLRSDEFSEIWKHGELSTGGRYVTVSGFGEAGDCALIGESFTRAPEVAMIEAGTYRSIRSFDIGYGEAASALAAAEPVSWKAPDGLDIQGWLLKPHGEGPYPLVMNIHGGPVWHWRPSWLGRSAPIALMLLRRGYAVFYPNPRGSSGRGQAFTRMVQGDLGGADAQDLIAGLDHLIQSNIANPKRIGVTGGSYGGYMTSWLVAKQNRFFAAVSLAPVTNRVSQQLTASHPEFIQLFMKDRYDDPYGKYFERSPIMFAHAARTPTLNICGSLDRCTPPEEAAQFHSALLDAGVESTLIVYPEEGHGVRFWPAITDYTAWLADWFDDHRPDAEYIE